jgi:hypothetical protein
VAICASKTGGPNTVHWKPHYRIEQLREMKLVFDEAAMTQNFEGLNQELVCQATLKHG